MRTSEEKDTFLILQLTVSYSIGEEIIMKYGGLVIYLVNGLKDLLKDKTLFNNFKVDIWEQALQFFRGIICEKLRGTSIDNVFLPLLTKENIVSINVEVKKADE